MRHYYGWYPNTVNLVVKLNLVVFAVFVRKHGLENVGYKDIEFACI
jgi:hypothetical protein